MTDTDADAAISELPTITVVENGAVWNVIMAHPSIRYGVGILDFCVDLDKALDKGHATLYDIDASAGANLTNYVLVSFPPLVRAMPQTRIYLSDEAWSFYQKETIRTGYRGRASHQGVSNYMAALVKANPLPTDWYDARNDDDEQLNLLDEQRLNDGKFPLWSRAYGRDPRDDNDPRGPGRDRHARNVNTLLLTQIVDTLGPIARQFGITPYRGGSVTNLKLCAYAALEAIGLQLLKPHHPAPPNPRPKKWFREGHNNAIKADSKLVF